VQEEISTCHAPSLIIVRIPDNVRSIGIEARQIGESWCT
jgi:hypothetical protein